jgi:hypothetical protein
MTNGIGLATNPEPPAYQLPCCPLCGEECDTLFYDRFGDIVGCDNCVTTRDAWEVAECFHDERGEE